MQIEITTDHHIKTGDHLVQEVSTDIETLLARFSDRITRVELHLGDDNGAKSGPADKKCAVEVRPAKQKPVGVTHHASTLEEAWKGALHKVVNLLDHRFGKLDHRKGAPTIRRPESR